MRLITTIQPIVMAASMILFASHAYSADTTDGLARFNGIAFGMEQANEDTQELSDTVPSEVKVSQLIDSMLNAVINDYARKNDIEVTPELKQAFLDRFEGASNLPIQKQHALAEKFVKQWLVEKSLYSEFGGTVVYRPTNPLMPIEGYYMLLKTYEEQGKLEFTDTTFSKAFWSLFSPPYQLVVASEAVDYSTPWWNLN